ncbi:MAG: thioredoxin [Anaerotignaceae bacterium]
MSVLKITKDNFQQEVMNSNKPVLLDFWAPWCGPCKMVGPTVEQVAQEAGAVAKVGKVNVDEEPELAQSFNVMSIPTLVVMKNGKIVKNSVGVKSKQDILSMIQ